MEFKKVVFNTAREGKLYILKLFLEMRVKSEVKSLVNSYTNGCTPLLIASRNGHADVVEYLIEQYADVEQVGSVTFDGETIVGAPPLWCAAAAGHMDVVKVLVKHNACLNSTTKTNSTPLRAACFDGHFEVVKFLIENGADVEIPNNHGHTCLMIACYKGHQRIARFLMKFGADVNRKSVKGNTALHDSAESGSLEIMKQLLFMGAKIDVDSNGMTPLLSASIAGQKNIVEYLISLPIFDKKAKIDALELLGATFVDKNRDMLEAARYWRRALSERYADSDNRLEKPSVLSPICAYENTLEFNTVEQLESVQCDPDEMRMQSLLLRERILGPAHPETSYYIRYRGAVYADTGNFERCIRLWMYALDMQQQILEPLTNRVQSTLMSFAELFSFMISESWMTSRSRRPVVQFSDLLAVFQRALKEVEMAMRHMSKIPPAEQDSSYFHRTLIIVMHLMGLMCHFQSTLSKDEDEELKRAVYRLVRLNPRGRNNWTTLHLASFKDTSSVVRFPICSFPSAQVVKLLLEVGASPNAIDLDHNTPLHVAATNKPFARTVVKVLLDHGAHLDICNLEKKTPLQLLNGYVHSNICPLQHITLKCLSAQTIMKNQIPFRNLVPVNLEDFVASH